VLFWHAKQGFNNHDACGRGLTAIAEAMIGEQWSALRAVTRIYPAGQPVILYLQPIEEAGVGPSDVRIPDPLTHGRQAPAQRGQFVLIDLLPTAHHRAELLKSKPALHVCYLCHEIH
jgi:hypothetical protein